MRRVVWTLLFAALPARAWFDGGHMVVAYIAYKNLTPQTKLRVDALLTRNPMYATWTSGAPADQRGLAAFVKAATWADCIKDKACSPGYTSDGGDTPQGRPTDGQNIGYADHLMHKYWHYVDVPYEEGAPGHAAQTPNALTQIQLFMTAVAGDASDDIKSYDVVWLEHLVGDVHQPLHATSRFTKNHPNGDAGGNFVVFCAKPCRDELHAYWDGLLGDKLTMDEVAATGDSLMTPGKPASADGGDPAAWINVSFQLAKAVVYVAPISTDNDPGVPISPRPDANYQAAAMKVARSQVSLAGYRLARLLNQNLK
jgi:S1/P1 Nuclease